MFLQQERLGGVRVILQGLDELLCPTIFWALDPHQNSHWQTPYARLFDLVCSTQRRWAEHFQAHGTASTAWLTWSGFEAPFVPWPERGQNLAFVGVVNDHRPIRRNMCAYLHKDFGLEPSQGVSWGRMREIYAQARIVPNESIFGEVNMRLFEAASCGCAVVGQTIDEDVEELFEPGREMLVFDHVLELRECVNWLLKHPIEGEKLGRRAKERVQAEHLPRHRASRLLELAMNTAQARRPLGQSIQDYWLALHNLSLAGCFLLPSTELETALASLAGQNPNILRALLENLYACGKRTDLEALLVRTVQGRIEPGNPGLYLACSAAAQALGRFNLARQFWQIHVRVVRKHPPNLPETPSALFMDWARILNRHGERSRPGFVFDSKRHLPETALECLILAGSLTDKPDLVFDRVHHLLRDFRGYNEFRLQAQSWLSLRRRKDWRLGMDLGLTNLRVFRQKEGLEELSLALD
ncbi:MAG: glycosyltransferase family 1 protein, partial [Deltaproteobacteria bacterium]|nr:glycosyltransferase family 1 protein [Deltaproteobacteria bacterium]